MTSARKKFIVYNIVFIIFFFSLAETIIEVLLNRPQSIPHFILPSFKKYYSNYDVNIIQFIPAFSRYDSTLSYTLKPGTFEFANREFKVLFEVNDIGVRDDAMSLDHPQIVVLGDSYAMGWGVHQDSTFSELLSRKVGKKVLNTAVSSYGTYREFKMLEMINTDSMSHLILQYSPNDFGENQAYLKSSTKPLRVIDAPSYSYYSRLHESVRGYYPFKHIIKFASILSGTAQYWTDVVPSSSDSAVSVFMNVFENNINKIPPYTKIVIFCVEPVTTSDSFFNSLREALRQERFTQYKERIVIADFSDRLNKKCYFVLDDHINSAGHQVIADGLGAIIN